MMIRTIVIVALLSSSAWAFGFGSQQQQQPQHGLSGSEASSSSAELESALRKIQQAQQEIAHQKELLAQKGEPGLFERLKSSLTPGHGVSEGGLLGGDKNVLGQQGQGIGDVLRQKAANILPSTAGYGSSVQPDVSHRLSQMVDSAKESIGDQSASMAQKLKDMMGGHHGVQMPSVSDQSSSVTQKLKDMMGGHGVHLPSLQREPTLAERASSYAESVKDRITDTLPSSLTGHVKPLSLKERIAESLRRNFGFGASSNVPTSAEQAQQQLKEAWDTTKYKAQDMLESIRRPVYETASAYSVSGQLPSWIGPRHYNAYRNLQLVESTIPKEAESSAVHDYKQRIRSLVDHLGREEMKYNELLNLRSKVKSDSGVTWFFHQDSRIKVDEINTLIRDTDRTMTSIEDDINHMLKEVKPFAGLASRMFFRDFFSFVPDMFKMVGETIASVFGLGLFSVLVGGPTIAALGYGIAKAFGPQLWRILAGVPSFMFATWWLFKLPNKIVEYDPSMFQFLFSYVPIAGGLIALATYSARAIIKAVSLSDAQARAKFEQAKQIANDVLPAGAAPVSSVLPEGAGVEGSPGGPSATTPPSSPAVSSTSAVQTPPPSLDTSGRITEKSGPAAHTRHRTTATPVH